MMIVGRFRKQEGLTRFSDSLNTLVGRHGSCAMGDASFGRAFMTKQEVLLRDL